MTRRRLEYLKYLESRHWHLLRGQAFKRDRYKCLKCGSSKNLQGHHKRYKADFRQVPLDWIETVCKKCHEDLHQQKALKRKRNRKIKQSVNRLTWLIAAFSATN